MWTSLFAFTQLRASPQPAAFGNSWSAHVQQLRETRRQPGPALQEVPQSQCCCSSGKFKTEKAGIRCFLKEKKARELRKNNAKKSNDKKRLKTNLIVKEVCMDYFYHQGCELFLFSIINM